MAKIVEHTFGKLVEAVNSETGEDYRGWRHDYLNRPGLIVICESQRKRPGKRFIYLYPNEPDSNKQTYLLTGMGDISMEENRMTILTINGSR